MLGAYHRQYERLMAHWKKVLPHPILEIGYEELVADVERVSREIVSFCKLSWHDTCLTFIRPSGWCGPPATSRCGSRSIRNPWATGKTTHPIWAPCWRP